MPLFDNILSSYDLLYKMYDLFKPTTGHDCGLSCVVKLPVCCLPQIGWVQTHISISGVFILQLQSVEGQTVLFM